VAEQSIPGKKTRINALSYKNLFLTLMEGPHTYKELAEETGLAVYTIRTFMTAFRKSPRLVRIAEWHEDVRGYQTTPAFQWGTKPDAKRTPLSNAERQRLCRQRKKIRQLQSIWNDHV
jgi:hypothetical protein